MSKRRETPALFELVRSSGIKKPGSASRPPVTQESPRPSRKSESDDVAQQAQVMPSTVSATTVDEPAGMGRTIRVPLGYVVLAVSATVVLLVIAYSVGFTRGKLAEADARTRMDRAPFEESNGGEGGTSPTDISNDRSEQAGGTHPANLGSDRRPQGANSDRTNGPTFRQGQGNAAARDVDTRQVGLNYIIVEQFGEDEAEAVADFLQRQGIDVMVLPTNNRNLRQVIVREGFEGWRSNSQAQQMLGRIKRLGQQWKRDYGGTKDFEDAFGSRFDG